MSQEIKLEYGEVEQALSTLKSSTGSLETTVPSSIGNQNVLDVVKKLNKLNHSLQEALTSYKALLIHNEEATRKSVDAMRETDEKLATSLHVK
ncbi:translation initiation factor 2B subunit (eIF-2B alpha/beta/delta family) [Oikeobacillus pervagus]|uniref:Translation initiation factor 2B subunit (eIF-2B alpha/beta/delta family) n=1 Tax=Oikeobacillus pervagus TaxID=1325931 RepID=A0AAJ1WJS7_9BACI|nr:YwqI/YxiC family protein [Oikeobacillus pervagus]MDQ0215833.1 translation initiation factor 2B subunit (eIF-2B alpha/beta/delta family) [Oikeobacillus pervagus]